MSSNEEVEENSSLPENKRYSEQEYWEERFSKESQYEWLVSYSELKSDITPFLKAETKILIIGCGNSPFSFDLYDDGYKNITNVDYSKNVIQNMKQKDKETYGDNNSLDDEPKMIWKDMDMIHMDEFTNESFDVVIDKAGIDAILTKEGDVWNPNPKVIEDVYQICSHVSRILNKGGYFLSISFMQPHFRKKYLLDLHERSSSREFCTNSSSYDSSNNDGRNEEGLEFCNQYQWSLKYSTIGDGTSGFPNYLYSMHKN